MTSDSDSSSEEFSGSNFSIQDFSVVIIDGLTLELRFPVSHPKNLDQCRKILSISLQWDFLFSLWHWSSGAEDSLH